MRAEDVVIGFFLMTILISLGTFTVWMFLDTVRRPMTSKIPWTLIIALSGPIGALIYYFLHYHSFQKSQDDKSLTKTSSL